MTNRESDTLWEEAVLLLSIDLDTCLSQGSVASLPWMQYPSSDS